MANVAIDSDTAVINAVNFTQQGSAPTSPAASHWKLYFLSSGLWYVNSGGTTTQLVTSVGLTMPAEFSVASSPVTSSGTIAVTKANQSANQVWAGPSSGAAATPTFRALVAADVPVMQASGASHAAGAAPDPGASAGTTKFLREDATWDVPAGSFTDPTTTKGDLIVHGASTTRMAVGADGTILTADSTQTLGVKWGTALSNPMTTAGDLIVGGTAGAATRLAVGTAGQRLSPSGSPLSPVWEDDVVDINFVIDGGGSTITTGMKGYIEINQALTITANTLLADQSGSIVVNVWKCTYTQFDAGATHPVVGDKITASAPPTITTATKSTDSTLTGWTTSVSAGDILAFNVDSVTTVQRVTLCLKCAKAA